MQKFPILKVSERPATQAVNELTYDWKAGEFTRSMPDTTLRSAFEGKEGNKRRRFVEKLLKTKAYIKTKTLADSLHSTEKQVGTLAAAINDKLMVDLALAEKVINSKRGSGYRINPVYMIVQKK
jgi:hypothetical protein